MKITIPFIILIFLLSSCRTESFIGVSSDPVKVYYGTDSTTRMLINLPKDTPIMLYRHALGWYRYQGGGYIFKSDSFYFLKPYCKGYHKEIFRDAGYAIMNKSISGPGPETFEVEYRRCGTLYINSNHSK